MRHSCGKHNPSIGSRKETIRLRAQAIHPKVAMIAFNLACYASVTGRMEEAKVRLRQAVDLDNDIRRLALDEDLRPGGLDRSSYFLISLSSLIVVLAQRLLPFLAYLPTKSRLRDNVTLDFGIDDSAFTLASLRWRTPSRRRNSW
jgi:hypothetical protein